MSLAQEKFHLMTVTSRLRGSAFSSRERMNQNPYVPPPIPSDSPAADAVSRRTRLSWAAGCWFPFGMAGAANVLMHALGYYDPRSDDGMDAAVYPLYLALIWTYIALSTIASALILFGVSRNLSRTVIVLWFFQGLALASCVVVSLFR